MEKICSTCYYYYIKIRCPSGEHICSSPSNDKHNKWKPKDYDGTETERINLILDDEPIKTKY